MQELDTHARALKQFLESNGIVRGDSQVSEQSRQLIGRIVGAVCEATVCLTLLTAPKVGEVIPHPKSTIMRIYHQSILAATLNRRREESLFYDANFSI